MKEEKTKTIKEKSLEVVKEIDDDYEEEQKEIRERKELGFEEFVKITDNAIGLDITLGSRINSIVELSSLALNLKYKWKDENKPFKNMLTK